jgi:hypothetical protein
LRTATLQLHILQAEAEQNRFLSPLIDMPITIFLFFSHAQFTAI